MMKTMALATCLLLSGLTGAHSQSIQGAWTWVSQGRYGADQNTMQFGPDGSYVRVSRWGNGTLVRYWGTYTATQVSPTQVRVQSFTQGWLPNAFCAQAPGFPVRCSPSPHPPEMALVAQFTSPSTLLAEGMVLSRDPSPRLLQAQVPQQAFSVAAAPVQPTMQQPVMPALHPYVTPNGPGNQAAAANHANAQNFINGRMRGCYTAANGRLYGCEQ